MEKKKTILNKPNPRLVAIVGGSGAGKTFLASKLKKEFGKDAMVLALDDFYRDLAHLPMERRCGTNFDDPKAIDWVCLERTLRQLVKGKAVRVPCYDFATHCRRREERILQPKGIIIVDGLWLLRRPSLRGLFDLKIFLECTTALRFERRLRRDVAERGRTKESVCEQFIETVAPMHKRFVQRQARFADVVMAGTFSDVEVKGLVRRIAGGPGNGKWKMENGKR